MHQMIGIKALAHAYNREKKINFDDWQVSKGEQWLLLGNSGSGKSTLLHILTGILSPATGQVKVNDTEIYQLKPRELDRFRALHVGIVFQRPHLIKSLTIQENLLMAQSFAGLAENRNRIQEVLESLAISASLHQYPSTLSQGQLQRASIARAVINKPALLIADEPTSSLDDHNAGTVLRLLKEQTELNQSTLVIATHDQRIKEAFTHTYTL